MFPTGELKRPGFLEVVVGLFGRLIWPEESARTVELSDMICMAL
jgi:hypothetical protein